MLLQPLFEIKPNGVLPLVSIRLSSDAVQTAKEALLFSEAGSKLDAETLELCQSISLLHPTFYLLKDVLRVYHVLCNELSPVEQPLLEDRFEELSSLLTLGATSITYGGAGVSDYLRTLRLLVLDEFQPKIVALQSSVKEIAAICSHWQALPQLQSVFAQSQEEESLSMDDLKVIILSVSLFL